MTEERLVPARAQRTEITVVNSRFITSIYPATSVDEVRSLLHEIRAEMPGANHHVYAFRIGHGNSVIEGMSDDGEPSGTSGPPALAVLRGSGVGDILVVVTRFFGGTKLGTGGLVRAYSDAVRTGLAALETRLKIARTLLGIELSYSLFEQAKRIIDAHEGVIEDQDFGANVTLLVRIATDRVDSLTGELKELSAGQIEPVTLEQSD